MSSFTTELRRLQADIRQRLRTHGTDVDLNDRDPTGDGDQSPILLNHSGKQVYRNLFAEGGDIAQCGQADQISRFAVACVMGIFPYVEEALEEADDDPAKPSDRLIQLLETRETSMRLTPLLLIVSAGKNIVDPSADRLSRRQVKLAQILLRYGARPDAKDVCGKTVCHYGAGMMATQMTMDVVTMCIEAAESSYLFGEEVELFGLKNDDMNGKRGVARGFVTESGRRAVFIGADKRQVAVRPDNIRLYNKQAPTNRPRLCDAQDRLGGVCLHEVVMADRDDVATFLLDQHRARVDVDDSDGVSPQRMAVTPGASMVYTVAALVKSRVTEEGRANRKAAKGHCSQCGTVETAAKPLSLCARCKSTQVRQIKPCFSVTMYSSFSFPHNSTAQRIVKPSTGKREDTRRSAREPQRNERKLLS